MTYVARETATVFVLKRPIVRGERQDLDGYVFADRDHAETWCAQPYAKGSTFVEVVAERSRRRCGCCGGIHWWMTWRGARVLGAWRPPSSLEQDDGED